MPPALSASLTGVCDLLRCGKSLNLGATLRGPLFQRRLWATFVSKKLRRNPARDAPAEMGEVPLNALLMDRIGQRV